MQATLCWGVATTVIVAVMIMETVVKGGALDEPHY